MTEKDVYKNGVALLEEWEDVNYCEHSFKFKDEWLTDKEVVDKLNELHEKKEILEVQLKSATNEIDKLMSEINTLMILAMIVVKKSEKKIMNSKDFLKS